MDYLGGPSALSRQCLVPIISAGPSGGRVTSFLIGLGPPRRRSKAPIQGADPRRRSKTPIQGADPSPLPARHVCPYTSLHITLTAGGTNAFVAKCSLCSDGLVGDSRSCGASNPHAHHRSNGILPRVCMQGVVEIVLWSAKGAWLVLSGAGWVGLRIMGVDGRRHLPTGLWLQHQTAVGALNSAAVVYE